MADDRQPTRSFRWFAGVLFVASALGFVASAFGAGWFASRSGFWPNWTIVAVFGGLVLLSENLSIQFPTSLAISPQLVLVMAAIVAFNDRGAVIGALIIGAGGGLVLRSIQHRRWAVTCFNIGQMSLSAGTAALVADSLNRAGASDWLTFALTPVTYIVVNAGLVLPAVALRTNQPVRSVWLDARTPLVSDLAFGVVGVLLGRLYRAAGPISILAVVVPAVVARTVFVSVVRFRLAYHRLELLYGFAKELDRTRDAPDAVAAMLEQFRTLLIADLVEVTMLSELGWRRTTLHPGAHRADERQGSGAPVEADPVPEEPVLIAQLDADHPLALAMADRRITSAMLAPLWVDERLIGTILVGSPANDRAFDTEDLRLLETLANHAAVFMENNRLVGQMRFDSHHDPLTGLPNRVRFNELMAASTVPSAVLLVDLDRFKEVNDTLGHDHGDLLLGLVAGRIADEIGTKAITARLGGDEFGVLLPATTSGDAAQVAVALLAALEQPFLVAELELEITASIGVSVAGVDTDDPKKLLQQADVAMYSAKEAHSGWELYSAERDHYSPWRLSLASALRRAIDTGELEVHYQPKSSLLDRRIVGLEALVRWRHPRLGMISPDQFVPIAEHAGLIRPLTLLVLTAACRQHQLLRGLGFDLDFAVNLSVRSVLDVNLPDQVGAVLQEHHVDPAALTLEITEGSLMADPARTIGVLGRLSALGTSVSIDDFGTGFSSLGYLKRLPADEVKIDRSFVAGMLTNLSDAAIVRSTIDLAHNLGLRAVAEGVQDSRTWTALADLGCDHAQGFYISPPLPGDELVAWLHGAQRASDPLF